MPQIYVNIKQAGKKKPILKQEPYVLPDDIYTLRNLLIWFTEHQVEVFNAKTMDEKNMGAKALGMKAVVEETQVLTEEEIKDNSILGKISFGRRHGDKQADKKKAVETTLEAFADGLVRVFQNDQEVTDLDSPMTLKENDVFTFIRLTFLAGRMW